ncbi:hypothetical protein PR003_g11996 [Phytophthora rubi]|uniref:C2 domain-containing protein n=1 Tax=Phytophthora rubi TaxID=129364 RepID=A0A6A3MKX9_9STRA|nr:hypothetical protein PR001_g11279 [Phytophthora rubi]KAE9337453.1 hypothetical protein PR003_g11996 [Phytophthora rubi]
MGQASSTPAASSSTPAASEPVAVPENSVLDVELEIVAAKDIAAGDYFGAKAALKGHVASSDAYALIEVAGQKVAWTRPIFDTLEPVWNEKFFFRNVRPDTLCKLYLLDKDFDGDDALGQAQFTAANTDGAETTFELPITREDKPAGTIVVKVKSHPTPEIGDGKLQQVGPVDYSLHPSFVNGVITDTTTDDEKRESFAYHVQLHDIPAFLATDNEWNHNHKPVQKIFSPDHPEAPVLRKAVATEHAVVYKHDAQTIYGDLKGPEDFFNLLHDACSSQFHIEKGLSGKYTLVIDNNSGTYAPPKEELPQLKALFETNFPGISVETHDRSSPELKEKRKEILDAWAA